MALLVTCSIIAAASTIGPLDNYHVCFISQSIIMSTDKSPVNDKMHQNIVISRTPSLPAEGG